MSGFFRVDSKCQTFYISRESVLHVETRGTDGKPAGWADHIDAILTLTGGVAVGLTPTQWEQAKLFLGIHAGEPGSQRKNSEPTSDNRDYFRSST